MCLYLSICLSISIYLSIYPSLHTKDTHIVLTNVNTHTPARPSTYSVQMLALTMLWLLRLVSRHSYVHMCAVCNCMLFATLLF